MPQILVLTANSQTTPLQLAAELRGMRDALGEQTNFLIHHESEVRAQDLIHRLLVERPDVLHFSGHGVGGGESALSLISDSGQPAALTRNDLRVIFGNLPQRPSLVVLNACFSEEIALELKNWVRVVIGVNGRIGDEIARRFSSNFYSGLGKSCSVRSAFELAKAELKISGYDDTLVRMDYLAENEPSDLIFYARPELLAQFVLGRNGKPEVSREHYDLHLWLRGVDQRVDSVTYEICHNSFKQKDRFWEVSRSESSCFLTDDFRTTGDVSIRAVAWAKDRGIGIQTTVVESLNRYYGLNPPKAIVAAIAALT